MSIPAHIYSNIIPYDELKKHNSEKDCWMVIGGIVYDLTKFLPEHPGGPDVVFAVAGRDSTEEFEDIAHSESAREMAAEYAIGVIEGFEGKPYGTMGAPKAEKKTKKTGYSIVPIVLIGALASAIVYLASNK